MNLFYTVLSVSLLSSLHADWVEITDSLPLGYDQSEFLTDGYPLRKIISTDESLLIETFGNIYLSGDNGDTFSSTDAPFYRLKEPFQAQPTRFILDKSAAEIHATGNITRDARTEIISYLLNPQTGIWTDELIVVPNLNSELYGDLKNIIRDEGNHRYFAITEITSFGSGFPPIQSEKITKAFLWKSLDGETWARTTTDETPLGRVDDFFHLNGDLYVLSLGELIKSEDLGPTWDLVADSRSENANPSQYVYTTHGMQFFSIINEGFGSIVIDVINGFGTGFAIINPVDQTIIRVRLPIILKEVSSHGSLLFAVGNYPAEEGTITGDELIFFSANGGATWDALSTNGISFGLLNGTRGSLLPSVLGVTNLSLNSTYAYLVTNNQRLWRIPLSELNLAPTTQIILQPNHAIVAEGNSASLIAEATGSGQLSYQWTKDSVVLPNTNSPSLTIESVSESSAGNYAVTVTGDRGTATSRIARVDLATSFEAFALSNFPADKRGLEDDTNGNGLSNFEEYIHLIGDHDREKLPTFSLQNGSELGLFYRDDSYYLTIQIRKNIAAVDYDLQAVAAQQLGALSSGFDNAVEVGEPSIEDGVSIHTFRSVFDVQSSDQGFVQILFQQPDLSL